MSTIQELNKIGHSVVRKLRGKKLSEGKTFMIHSELLPVGQSYLEYPDSSMKVVEVGSDLRSFKIIKELSAEQAKSIRLKYNLM
jgi:hypothetical protein